VQNIIDSIVPIIVFIAVISGIINSIREASAKNARPVPQPSQRSRAQTELEAFLSGTTPTQQQPQSSPRPQRPAQQQQARQKQTPRVKSPKKQAPVETPAGRSTRPHSLGSGLADHVDSFIGDHVRSHMGRDVDAYVNKDIGERVKSHLGSQSSRPVEMSSSDTGSRAADELLSVLKTRVGVRHAVLVNEILSKPLAMRNR